MNDGIEEEEYFAMAAISALPEWVFSPEEQHHLSGQGVGDCLLPHVAL